MDSKGQIQIIIILLVLTILGVFGYKGFEFWPTLPKEFIPLKHECINNTDCEQNEVCKNNTCEEIRCISCEYTENHQCKSYECCSDLDCDDNNPETIGKCVEPATKKSRCEYKIIQKCEEGTSFGKCSNKKPKYCDNGNLVDKCSICGCPPNYKCQADEKCISEPVITLVGEATVNLTVGDPYTDAGATAHDNIDGDITKNITIGGDIVNTNKPGVYTITYDVTNSAGNQAEQVTRTINVSEPADTIPLEALHPKVLLIIFNPIIESRDNKRLTEVYGWNNPDVLSSQYIEDIKEVSDNLVSYQIVERMEVDAFPTYTDGYTYDDETFLSCWEARDCDHGDAGKGQPMLDYPAMLQQYNICEKLNTGGIDELWMFASPYSGFWESTLAGPGAFWYNSSPVQDTSCNKLLPIMGFNYERGVGEMLEDLGHRTEATMTHVYGSWTAGSDSHTWNQYTLIDKDSPGNAHCGNVHYGPNSLRDYDWSNYSYVDSYCDDWYNYPNLQGIKKSINCEEWGCNIRGHHKWWLKHLPKTSGQKDEKLNNWWRYIVDYNNI